MELYELADMSVIELTQEGFGIWKAHHAGKQGAFRGTYSQCRRYIEDEKKAARGKASYVF